MRAFYIKNVIYRRTTWIQLCIHMGETEQSSGSFGGRCRSWISRRIRIKTESITAERADGQCRPICIISDYLKYILFREKHTNSEIKNVRNYINDICEIYWRLNCIPFSAVFPMRDPASPRVPILPLVPYNRQVLNAYDRQPRQTSWSYVTTAN